jgi:adenine C2-methylase RlmN of 23S rRNA A2503 and tRNA A37
MDFESDTDKIQSLMQKGNLHAAFNIALSGVNEGKRQKDTAKIKHFLTYIKAITRLIESTSTLEINPQASNSGVSHCSFCGTGIDKVKLYLSADTAICEQCAKQAMAHFADEPRRQ